METETTGGSALTAFENNANKAMQKILQVLKDKAAEATAADHALANSIRGSGRGLRIETISPVVAAIIVLQHNQFNRNISISKVEQMVQDMRAKEWREHHQGVAFTPEGDLADGQHRLVACALSGVAMTSAVFSDFNMAAIDAIDRSTRRTLVQVMQMRGTADAQTKVRVGKVVVLIKHRIDHAVKTPNFSEHRLNAELRKIDGALTEGIELGRMSVRNVTSPSLEFNDAAVVATLLVLSNWAPEHIITYLTAVQEGVATYDNAPTLTLSKQLMKARDAAKKDKMDQTTRIALALKTAKLFAEGKRAGKLVWNEHQEGIPDPTVDAPQAQAAE